jgi:predicted metal-dependent peptidase
MADIASAEMKITKILMDWFTSDPIMMNVYCMINRKPDPSQNTIGLDIRTAVPTLKYNPNFINSISMERLELVMISEGFKVLLRHCTTRLKEPRQISSLASSVTVNQLLNNNIKSLLTDIDDITPNPKKFGLENNKYFEEYYRKLMDQVDETTEKIEMIWNSLSDEQKQEVIDKSQGGNEPQGGDGQGDGFKEYDNQKDAMSDYFDPNGTTNKDWGTNDLFDAEVKNFIEDKKGSARGWGKHTGSAMAEIYAANEPKISYKEVIRRFSKSVVVASSISSRMKVNRRFDIQLPGYRRQYRSRIMFAVDVSGSMGDRELAEGFAVINSVCKHADIMFVQFDTEIKSIEKKMKNARTQFKIHGRGGTDFQMILDLAEKENIDGLVIFTDGMADAPKKPKHTKVLWLLHGTYKPPVAWGYRAWLKLYEDTHM